MPSFARSLSFPSYANGRTATVSDINSLLPGAPVFSDVYQTVMQSYADEQNESYPRPELGALYLSNTESLNERDTSGDARALAHAAWSRAYIHNNPDTPNRRPSISRALTVPPMPHIIDEFTTSLPRDSYYMFLAKCWNHMDSHEHRSTPPPITAHSFDLLHFDEPTLQVTVSEPVLEKSDVGPSKEIPVDTKTLDRLVKYIDILLEEDDTLALVQRFGSVEPIDDTHDVDSEEEACISSDNKSILADSDKENLMPPRFFPDYASDDEDYELGDVTENNMTHCRRRSIPALKAEIGTRLHGLDNPLDHSEESESDLEENDSSSPAQSASLEDNDIFLFRTVGGKRNASPSSGYDSDVSAFNLDSADNVERPLKKHRTIGYHTSPEDRSGRATDYSFRPLSKDSVNPHDAEASIISTSMIADCSRFLRPIAPLRRRESSKIPTNQLEIQVQSSSVDKSSDIKSTKETDAYDTVDDQCTTNTHDLEDHYEDIWSFFNSRLVGLPTSYERTRVDD